MTRNNTNALLNMLAQSIEDFPDEETSITVVVGGLLITGTMITEEQYFSRDENIALREMFNKNIRDVRDEILSEWDNGNNDSELPDEIAERFIYLKDAGYILGNTTYKGNGSDDMSVQIRISDISAFTYRGLNTNLKIWEKL